MIESLRTGQWLTPERLRIYPVLLLSLLSGAIIFLLAASHGNLDWTGRPLGPDFSEIWIAGEEVRENRPAAVYDTKAHVKKQAEVFGPSEDVYLWLYPPYFLAVAAFLAALPYLAALLIWQAGTLAFYVTAMLSILKPLAIARREALIATLAFPAVFVNLAHGQNGFLTAALLAGGLLSLNARPLVAGVLFACLAYKPQFAMMIPIALIAGAYWRTIVSGMLTLCLLTIATLAAFGREAWAGFWDHLGLAKSLVLEQGGAGYEKMQSAFAAARLLGASAAAAYCIQAVMLLGLISIIGWLWSSAGDFRLKGAALLTAAFLATPYSFDYDLVILGPALALAVSFAYEHGFRTYEKSLFACVWILPLLARPIAISISVPLSTFVLTCFFLMIMRRMHADSPVPINQNLLSPVD